MATLVRPARPADKAPLMEFISRIWGGHDYIPKVWDEWMRERGARMLVVEVDGRPVGMSRVKFLDDGSAWFEGARVHPKFRGKGLASMLGEKAMKEASIKGVRTVGLVSNARNIMARRQISKMGFAEKARVNFYAPRKHASLRAQRNVRLARSTDVPSLLELMRSSPESKFGGGVFWDGFRATAITPKTVRGLVRNRRVYLSGNSVAIFKQGMEGDEVFHQVGFASGDPRGVRRLIRHLLRESRGRRVERYLCAPSGSPLASSAKEAGLSLWSSFVLYQRRVTNG